MLQNIGNAMYYQRSFAGAMRAYEQGLALQRAAANDEGIANAPERFEELFALLGCRL